jgi:hypothetical protein
LLNFKGVGQPTYSRTFTDASTSPIPEEELKKREVKDAGTQTDSDKTEQGDDPKESDSEKTEEELKTNETESPDSDVMKVKVRAEEGRKVGHKAPHRALALSAVRTNATQTKGNKKSSDDKKKRKRG